MRCNAPFNAMHVNDATQAMKTLPDPPLTDGQIYTGPKMDGLEKRYRQTSRLQERQSERERRERERKRETGRQTDRQTDRQTEGQRDRQTETERDRQTDRLSREKGERGRGEGGEGREGGRKRGREKHSHSQGPQSRPSETRGRSRQCRGDGCKKHHTPARCPGGTEAEARVPQSEQQCRAVWLAGPHSPSHWSAAKVKDRCNRHLRLNGEG